MTIIEVLRELNVQYATAGQSPHVTSGWAGLVCPYCDNGKGNYGLGINLGGSGRYSVCWRCGPHRTSEALHLLTGRPWKEIKGLLREAEGEYAPLLRRTGKYTPPAWVGPLERRHRAYLRRRGYSPEALTRLWGVQGIGLAAKLAWRVFIPIQLDGVNVSWTTRSTDPDCPKSDRYRTASPEEESVPSTDVLYGWDKVGHSVVVHEGVFDVWATGPGAVAVLGLRVSPAQLEMIASRPLRVVAFDPEPDAQRRAKKLCDRLAPFPGRTVRVELEGGDAGWCLTNNPRELDLLRRYLK